MNTIIILLLIISIVLFFACFEITFEEEKKKEEPKIIYFEDNHNLLFGKISYKKFDTILAEDIYKKIERNNKELIKMYNLTEEDLERKYQKIVDNSTYKDTEEKLSDEDKKILLDFLKKSEIKGVV